LSLNQTLLKNQNISIDIIFQKINFSDRNLKLKKFDEINKISEMATHKALVLHKYGDIPIL